MLRKLFPWLGVLTLMFGVVACDQAPTAAAVSATAEASQPVAVATAASAAQQTEQVPVPAGSALSPAEVADLLHMREEEKLARDVYLALYDQWGAQVFQNIARSEQMHMDAIATLLATYNLEDPVAQTGDLRGTFADPDLQALYEQLVEQGSTSLVDALTVGATIEDLDIKDLDQALARTDKADIQQVYENLKWGSENHMRAFVGNLRAQGADYTPQFITPEAFQQILSGTMGRGAGQGHGPGTGCGTGVGQGQGPGNGQGQGGPNH